MRYLPKSPAERQEMLSAIGAESIDELFSSIPERYRLRQALNLPGPFSEAEIIQYFTDRAAENSRGYTSFRGAGVYNHLRSVVTDAIIQRGEFLTSYTPYQAEISQGTLQAIFEFQTLMCQLTGQEVANASMWDGSTATTEAVLMAERITNQQRVLVARSLHPEYRDVLKTYAKHSGLHVEEIPFSRNGSVDQRALQSEIRDDVAAVVLRSPKEFRLECSGRRPRPTLLRWKDRALAFLQAMADPSSASSPREKKLFAKCRAALRGRRLTPTGTAV